MIRTKHLLLAFSFLAFISLTSCGGGGGDDEPLTPEEERILALAGSSGITWTATSITFDGAAATGFDNFSITFRSSGTSQTYTSVDGEPVFGAQGTWAFNGTNISQMVFDGNNNNIFAISALNTAATPATVRLTVNFTAGGGAAAGTDGEYVFNLQAQ